MSAVRDIGGILGAISGFAVGSPYTWRTDRSEYLDFSDVALENIGASVITGIFGGAIGYTAGWLLENFLVSGNPTSGVVPFIGN